jgi:hypothetical protein
MAVYVLGIHTSFGAGHRSGNGKISSQIIGSTRLGIEMAMRGKAVTEGFRHGMTH